MGREIRRAGYEGKLAAGAVITGGTSLLEGMPDAAERVLDLPVRRGVPTGVGGLRDIVSHPMFATGVGLILHARRMDYQFEKVGFLGSRNGGERLGGILDRIKGWAIDFF